MPEGLLYDPELSGLSAESVYDLLAANLRKCAAEGREFTSGYTRRASKGTKVSRNTEPDAAAMQHELTYLRQQVEFLKKITELGGGTERRR